MGPAGLGGMVVVVAQRDSPAAQTLHDAFIHVNSLVLFAAARAGMIMTMLHAY